MRLLVLRVEKLGTAGRKAVGEKFAGANGRHAFHRSCAILISPSLARRRLRWNVNETCPLVRLDAFCTVIITHSPPSFLLLHRHRWLVYLTCHRNRIQSQHDGYWLSDWSRLWNHLLRCALCQGVIIYY
jgi:hypothetical protein